jgi:hypothetical protein
MQEGIALKAPVFSSIYPLYIVLSYEAQRLKLKLLVIPRFGVYFYEYK